MIVMQPNDVNVVADLIASRKCQKLVGRSVPEIQSVTDFLIRLDREKAKGRIIKPFDFCALSASGDKPSLKRWLRRSEFDGVVMHLQHSCILCNGCGNTFSSIVKLDVSGGTRGIGCLMENRSAGNETIGVPILSQQSQDFLFEGS